MVTKEIVIVGAGYSGIAATRKLAKTFKKDESVNITLIDKNSFQTYMTELHEVAGGRIEPEAIKYDLRRLFARVKNVDIVTDTVEKIDFASKRIIAKHGTFCYDYLVLGMGGEANDFGVPGVKEHAFTLWSIEAAEEIRDHILRTARLAHKEHDEAKRRALLTYVVAGAGFTGVEMVGELIEWFDRLAKQYKLNRDEFSAYIVEAAPTILNMVTEKEQTRARRYMEKVGIQVLTGDGIKEVRTDAIELSSGKVIPTHTCIWTAGVQANSDTANFGIEKARANRLVANEYMEAKDHQGVYIVGDLVYYEDKNDENKPTPQIVQAAEQTGETAAANIIAAIKGGAKQAYKGKYDGFMVSIGSRYGVAYLNNKIHLQGFLAMLLKHLVNLYYFFTIRTGYYMVQYIDHEFFDIKDGRNVFRKHLSQHGNILWSVPLRIFYGSMWLYEGLKKLFGWFGTTSWFGDDVTLPFTWLQDPTSGASEATEEVVHTVFSLNYTYGEEPMQVLDKMPDWFESIMQVMVPNKEVALFMQKTMTIVEILIGLALIFGLFTFIVNAVTIALVAMFSLSGMFYWVNIWFVFVAFALMNGSGRAFGLDYYVMPWLQERLSRWWYGTPSHIYKRERRT